jgi:hypothetical protein
LISDAVIVGLLHIRAGNAVVKLAKFTQTMFQDGKVNKDILTICNSLAVRSSVILLLPLFVKN